MDKIKRPASIRPGFDEDRRSCSHSTPPSASLAHGKAFLPIEPVDPIDARWFALLAQQDKQPAVAEALALIGELTQLRPQARVRRPARAIPDHLAIGVDDCAGPPF